MVLKNKTQPIATRQFPSFKPSQLSLAFDVDNEVAQWKVRLLRSEWRTLTTTFNEGQSYF